MKILIYFDNAATTWPKPPEVVRAMTESLTHFGANPGRGGHEMSIRTSEKVYRCRESIASFFEMDDPSKVIFTSNATHSLNIVIGGLLRYGDHVICTSMEHNSVLRPIVSNRSGCDYTIVDADCDGCVHPSDIENAIKDNTRLVVVTHVSNVCGTINDINAIGAICRRRGILFMVDASQSAGILKFCLKDMPVDYLVAPGHKALYGPMGTGVLCINTTVIPECIISGGTGSYSHLMKQPDELPDHLESGTLNVPGICGLCAGINFVSDIGTDNILSHELELTSILLDGIAEISDIEIAGKSAVQNRCGVVSFVHRRYDSVYVSEYLNTQYSIAVRAMYHCAYNAHRTLGTQSGGTVRVSFGFFNDEVQVKTLLYALKHM